MRLWADRHRFIGRALHSQREVGVLPLVAVLLSLAGGNVVFALAESKTTSLPGTDRCLCSRDDPLIDLAPSVPVGVARCVRLTPHSPVADAVAPPGDGVGAGLIAYLPITQGGGVPRIATPAPRPTATAACSVLKTADRGIDAILDTVWVYSIRSNGEISAVLTDSDADGDWESRSERVYSPEDRLVQIRSDEDNDGAVDSTQTFMYDGDGHQIRAEWDRDADGRADEVYVWEYDSEGLMLTESLDSDGDGTTDRSVRFFYDTDNRCILIEEYSPLFPSPIRRSMAVWSGAVRVRFDIDDGGDGTIDRSFTWTYDDAVRVIRYERWARVALVDWYVYAYDGAGRILADYWYVGDGALEAEWHYSHDELGRTVSRVYRSRSYLPVLTAWVFGDTCPSYVDLDPRG